MAVMLNAVALEEEEQKKTTTIIGIDANRLVVCANCLRSSALVEGQADGMNHPPKSSCSTPTSICYDHSTRAEGRRFLSFLFGNQTLMWKPSR